MFITHYYNILILKHTKPTFLTSKTHNINSTTEFVKYLVIFLITNHFLSIIAYFTIHNNHFCIAFSSFHWPDKIIMAHL